MKLNNEFKYYQVATPYRTRNCRLRIPLDVCELDKHLPEYCTDYSEIVKYFYESQFWSIIKRRDAE